MVRKNSEIAPTSTTEAPETQLTKLLAELDSFLINGYKELETLIAGAEDHPEKLSLAAYDGLLPLMRRLKVLLDSSRATPALDSPKPMFLNDYDRTLYNDKRFDIRTTWQRISGPVGEVIDQWSLRNKSDVREYFIQRLQTIRANYPLLITQLREYYEYYRDFGNK